MERNWQEILDRWTQGKAVTEEDFARLTEEAKSDAELEARLGALLPFIRRDSAGVFGLRDEASDMSGRIMAAIEREAVPGATPGTARSAGRAAAGRWRQRSPRLRWALQIAVPLFILGVGFFLGFGYARSNTSQVTPAASAAVPNTVVVTFRLVAPEARSVALVGDFNDWEPRACELRNIEGTGTWEVSIPLRRDHVYTYNFLINGTRWISDPDSLYQVKDGFGGEKSVIQL